MIQFFKIRLWVVGRIRTKRPWEFQGIFWTKKRAIRECRDTNYFIGPITMNEALSHDTRSWPGSYYPRAIETETRRPPAPPSPDTNPAGNKESKPRSPEPPPAAIDPGTTNYD
jgi:hypothetical protein